MVGQTPRFTLDLSRLGAIDPVSQGTRVSFPSRASQLGSTQKSALRTLVNNSVTGMAIPNSGAIKKAFDVMDAGAADVVITGAAPAMPPAHYAHDVTIGIGFNVTCAAVVTISAGGGFYFSTLPEAGIYAAVGGGVTTNVSFFLGGTVTVVFGPPSTFAGDCLAVGVDVSLPPPSPFGGGGALLFSVSPPIEIIGFCIQFGFSPSVVPVDVTVQFSRTTLSKF